MDDLNSIFIRQINEKQEKAFHELFLRFFNYLVVYAMRRVQRRDVAEDIVQEVFVNVWEGDKEFNSYVGFRAFLYNAVANRCMDYLKHQVVEDRYAAVVMKEEHEWDELDMAEEEMYRELHLVVQELPERSRAVFELHLEGKKNEEIAQLLALSVLTVKSYKKNAMQYLRKRLGDAHFLLLAGKFF
ncbi:MAG: RNA polymerase sigma-70 factor [Butyricimonas faecihominis]